MSIFIRRIALTVLGGFASLCVSSSGMRAEDDLAALVRLNREISQVIGDPACGSVSFCRMLPMGYDPCGNPTRWVVFNTTPGVREIVETKASEVTFIEEELQRGKPRPRDCVPATRPRLACVNGRCTLGDASY